MILTKTTTTCNGTCKMFLCGGIRQRRNMQDLCLVTLVHVLEKDLVQDPF